MVHLVESAYPLLILQSLALPLEQLTWLKIDVEDRSDIDPAVYVDVLPRCRNLVRLDIALPGNEDTFIGSDFNFSIALPALKALHIAYREMPDRQHASLLCSLTMPRLEKLSLRYEGENSRLLWVALKNLQRRCVLSSLALHGHWMSNTKSLTSMLELFRSIMTATSSVPNIDLL